MPKDYGIQHSGKLEEREILFLKEKVRNEETILGLGKLIRNLKEFLPIINLPTD